MNWVVRLSLGLLLSLAGCVEAPPPEVARLAGARPEQSLRLVDERNWQLFEVKREVRREAGRPALVRTVELRDETSGELLIVSWTGGVTRWLDPKSSLVPPRVYLRSRYSAEYRFIHPWTGVEWVMEAQATSRRVGLISTPVAPENRPRFLFLPRASSAPTPHDPIGQLELDAASRRLFFGRLASSEVEIERVDALAWDRTPGLHQQLVASFPEAGEFVVRIDGADTARFLQRPKSGREVTYRLAIRRAAGEVDRALSLGVFLAFDRLREFVLDARWAEIR